MKNNKIFLIILILAGVFIVGAQFLPHDKQIDGDNEKVVPNTIEIKGYAFTPEKLKIKKGTTITWENFDLAPHTVTVDDEKKAGPKSKVFGKGEKFTYTFSEVATYAYHCEPHPYMKATIEVTE